MRPASLNAAALSLALTATLLGHAGIARAGTYDVYACGGPAGNAQSAFHPSAGPLMSAYSICPASNIATGVVTKVSSNGGVTPYLSGAYQIFDAPPGTTLESTTLSIAELRMETHWTVGIVAYDDFDVGTVVFGCQAWAGGCDVATPSFYGPVTVGLGGHSSFRLETRCVNAGGCSATSTGKDPANRALFSATQISVRVRDDSAPQVGVLSGSAWEDGWHHGVERVDFRSTDNSGNRFNRLYVDGQVTRADDFLDGRWFPSIRCDYTRPRPCTEVVEGWMEVDVTHLPDGMHTVRLEAEDPAGNVGAVQHTIGIDNTAPGKASAVRVEDGDGWRVENDFSLRWSNPPGQVAPIDHAFYSLCPTGGGDCIEGEQVDAGIDRLDGVRVPAPGDYELRVWLEDAAGNIDREHASDEAHLRFDDRPPQASFESQTLSDPLVVKVAVSDAESGVASATLEMRRAGTKDWSALDTQLAGSRATARIDDLALHDGVYEFRARVVDRAGNVTVTDRRGDGSKMELRLPLRSAVRIDVRPDPVARTSKCRRSRRRHCPIPKPISTHADGSALLRGRASSPSDDPLADARLNVTERARTGQLLSRSALETDEAGRFVYRSGANPSRTITFEYVGDQITKPSIARSELRVAARTSIKVVPNRTHNGGSAAFSGALQGDFIPTGGKLIHLQAHYRGRWRTFATPRTARDGRWRYRYRFGVTAGVVVYRFRALIPWEAAYPFEPARSRTVRVVVRG